MSLTTHLGARTSTKEAIRLFLRYIQRFSDNTQCQYRDVLWRFCEQMPPFIEQVTPEHIDRFIGGLKILNSSKNAILIPVRSFFRYLHDYHEIPNVAGKVKDLPNQPTKQRVVTEEEYEKLLKVCKPKECAVIKFLANSGLRATEFAELTPANISPDRQYMTVIGKGRKRRVVPLNAACRKCLPIIFSKSFTRDSLYQLCKSLSKRAGIPIAGPHALRHFFCTQMIRAGIPITKVSRILGHSSIGITEKIYTHLVLPDFLGCTDCLDL